MRSAGNYGQPPPQWYYEHPDRAEQWDPVIYGWLVRTMDDGAVVHVVPMLFTSAILISTHLGAQTYFDRWCYMSSGKALDAADAWTGPYPQTEPKGWHRHPPSGRRRENGAAETETIAF